MRAMIATIAMSARISAYSARPWPSSSRRSVARSELTNAMCGCLLNECALGRERRHSRDGHPVRPMERKSYRPWEKHRRARRFPDGLHWVQRRLDRRADVAQDPADLAAQEDEGDDRDN